VFIHIPSVAEQRAVSINMSLNDNKEEDRRGEHNVVTFTINIRAMLSSQSDDPTHEEDTTPKADFEQLKDPFVRVLLLSTHMETPSLNSDQWSVDEATKLRSYSQTFGPYTVDEQTACRINFDPVVVFSIAESPTAVF
jgi:hypothetical protein